MCHLLEFQRSCISHSSDVLLLLRLEVRGLGRCMVGCSVFLAQHIFTRCGSACLCGHPLAAFGVRSWQTGSSTESFLLRVTALSSRIPWCHAVQGSYDEAVVPGGDGPLPLAEAAGG